jgi:hypothetical protein
MRNAINVFDLNAPVVKASQLAYGDYTLRPKEIDPQRDCEIGHNTRTVDSEYPKRLCGTPAQRGNCDCNERNCGCENCGQEDQIESSHGLPPLASGMHAPKLLPFKDNLNFRILC